MTHARSPSMTRSAFFCIQMSSNSIRGCEVKVSSSCKISTSCQGITAEDIAWINELVDNHIYMSHLVITTPVTEDGIEPPVLPLNGRLDVVNLGALCYALDKAPGVGCVSKTLLSTACDMLVAVSESRRDFVSRTISG
eukprot:Blabericola_migrator_1__2720@NODE_1774_length_3813_cov_108_539242_g1144_i0_p2_GENE_NODE_1774_length_3813_cov_108_539242_g1144_i0NODE_1774_length_3813_cov_108_539242_g1144_i0_p2_ORF_typecomplete_len138_score11_75_NODE_1774_length_3813_cov_108_539242_g1144_i0180593